MIIEIVFFFLALVPERKIRGKGVIHGSPIKTRNFPYVKPGIYGLVGD